MAVFNVKFTWATLDDQPRFVIGEDWASTMKFCDIKGACLGAQGCKRNLKMEYQNRKGVWSIVYCE